MNNDLQDNGLTSTQNVLIRWQSVIAFGPFVLVVLFAQTGASNKLPHWAILPAIIVPVVWAVAFKGYALYLKYQKS